MLDFESFCRAMDARLPAAANGPPTSALFRPKQSEPRDTTAMQRAMKDAREATFTPKLTAAAASSTRHGPSVEDHLRALGARYEAARRVFNLGSNVHSSSSASCAACSASRRAAS